MTEAKDNLSADRLVKKMTTPPPDPLAFEEPPPSSYEKFLELAEEIMDSGREREGERDKRGSELWDSV